jgi:ribosomal protein S18 acetylase RimI-like enzyme
MQDIQIVPPKPEDTLGITTVFYKAWLSAYPNEEYFITTDDIEDHFKNAFTPEGQEKRRKNIESPAPNSFRLIAKDGDKVVGTATLIKDVEKNKLSTIYILPEYQGKGIGKKLWTGLKEKLNGSKKTIVQVAVYNKNAIAFYEKLGFKDNGKRWSDEKFRMKSGSVLPEMEMELQQGI